VLPIDLPLASRMRLRRLADGARYLTTQQRSSTPAKRRHQLAFGRDDQLSVRRALAALLRADPGERNGCHSSVFGEGDLRCRPHREGL